MYNSVANEGTLHCLQTCAHACIVVYMYLCFRRFVKTFNATAASTPGRAPCEPEPKLPRRSQRLIERHAGRAPVQCASANNTFQLESGDSARLTVNWRRHDQTSTPADDAIWRPPPSFSANLHDVQDALAAVKHGPTTSGDAGDDDSSVSHPQPRGNDVPTAIACDDNTASVLEPRPAHQDPSLASYRV